MNFTQKLQIVQVEDSEAPVFNIEERLKDPLLHMILEDLTLEELDALLDMFNSDVKTYFEGSPIIPTDIDLPHIVDMLLDERLIKTGNI